MPPERSARPRRWPRVRLSRRLLGSFDRHRPSRASRRLTRHFANGGDPVVLTDQHDVRFVLYPWDLDSLDELLSKSFYAPDFRAIERLLKPGDTAVDVGANIGSHSIMMSRRVGDQGRVYAFEPVARTAWLMRENLALNRASNVRLFDAAVSESPGTVEMHLYDQRYSAWNSIGSANFDGIEPIETVEVTAECLDHAMHELSVSRIHFLKIDVEGFEIDVLRGARRLLTTGSVDYLSFEISEIPLRASGHTAKEAFELLGSLGYECYKFDFDAAAFVGPFHDSDDFYVNFYASRQDLRLL
jgi:FkbM family methyltransferase